MNILEETRVKYKLSGAEVARAAGMDKSYYLNIEKGKYNPSAEMAIRISAAFTVLIGSELVSREDVVFLNTKQKAKVRQSRKKAA